MKNRKPTRSAHSLAAPRDRANGHAAAHDSSRAPLVAAAAAEMPREVANGRGRVSIPRDAAASADARGEAVAGAATQSAACPDLEAYADAAPATGRLPRHPETAAEAQGPSFPGPTESAALENGPSFARAVAARVDLVGVSASLVCSEDEKIRKAELDRLRQLIFDSQEAPEEPPRLDFGDLFKPDRPQ